MDGSIWIDLERSGVRCATRGVYFVWILIGPRNIRNFHKLPHSHLFSCAHIISIPTLLLGRVAGFIAMPRWLCHGYVSSQSCGSEESSKLYMCMLWQTAVQSLQNHTAHLPCCKSLTGVWLQCLSPVQHAGISGYLRLDQAAIRHC